VSRWRVSSTRHRRWQGQRHSPRVQGGQHPARQPQDRDHGHVPRLPVRHVRPALLGRVPVPLQPTLPHAQDAPPHARRPPGRTALRHPAHTAAGASLLFRRAHVGAPLASGRGLRGSATTLTALQSFRDQGKRPPAGAERARARQAPRCCSDHRSKGSEHRREGPFDVVFDAAAAYRWRQCHPSLSPLTN
jgi:hypothetical protein